VSPRTAYAIGLAAIAAASAAAGRVLAPRLEGPLAATWGAALLVQGPLGWWLVRSVGRPRFMGVWVTGMAARLLLVAAVGFVVIPALRWPAGPILIALVVLLILMLALEAVVVLLGQREGETE